MSAATGRRKTRGITDDELLALKVPKLTPSKQGRPGAGAAAAEGDLSTQSNNSGSPQARPRMAATPSKADEDESYTRVRDAFFIRITQGINHLPDWIVWGKDRSFKTIKYHPALVITETVYNILSPMSISDIKANRNKPNISGTSKWTVVEPRVGNRILAVFIFDKDGPLWNVAELAAGDWMPWNGIAGDEKSQKDAALMLSTFEVSYCPRN